MSAVERDVEFEISQYGRELTDFERGWIEGVSLYAWWKDGTQFVGTTGRTLRAAVEEFLAERPVLRCGFCNRLWANCEEDICPERSIVSGFDRLLTQLRSELNLARRGDGR